MQYHVSPSKALLIFVYGGQDSLGTIDTRIPIPNRKYLPLRVDVVDAYLLGGKMVADSVDNILDNRREK